MLISFVVPLCFTVGYGPTLYWKMEPKSSDCLLAVRSSSPSIQTKLALNNNVTY